MIHKNRLNKVVKEASKIKGQSDNIIHCCCNHFINITFQKIATWIKSHIMHEDQIKIADDLLKYLSENRG